MAQRTAGHSTITVKTEREQCHTIDVTVTQIPKTNALPGACT